MNVNIPWKHANKGLLIILGAFVLATIASIIFFSFTLLRLDQQVTSGNQNSQAARLMKDLLISLDDAETGARGYIITSDPKYLEPYTSAVKSVPQNLKTLESTEGVNAPASDIHNLEANANKQMALLKRAVDAKKAGDELGAEDTNIIGQSRATMDALRAQINTIVDRNLENARPNYESAHAQVRLALSVAVAVSVFVLGICIVLLWYFQRSILHERALESTKSEFLSLASHQLRTPATNVKQYLGLVLDGYLGKITKKQRGALEVAYHNNESEIRIMNDLLDVAKLDLKRIQLRKQQVNIVSLVKQVVKDFQQHAVSRGQVLEMRPSSDIMASVDREYLKGVIEKLIDNAIRYSKEKTRISVRAKVNDEMGVFEIIVKDQGLGIQKREIPKLFKKFSRIANEFSASSEGSGLGLYWVKQVMALHGGSVEVRTSEGRGSKFIVRAPLV